MSKGTIGTFAGAAIGFFITGGNPYGAQIGAMAGGAIGSSFDTVQGRRVGEYSNPQATEGEPIPWVCGSARVRGRLMDFSEPVKRTEKDGGKGGPGVKNEYYEQSYSILVCESSELRDSSIDGILIVTENNKIVYDMSENPAISAADSAKWLENVIFYFGEETQLPDPTEEMIHGAGNVPAYRGLCRFVKTAQNITDLGGSIPTYEIVTRACADVPEPEPVPLPFTWMIKSPDGYFFTSPDPDTWDGVYTTGIGNNSYVTATGTRALFSGSATSTVPLKTDDYAASFQSVSAMPKSAAPPIRLASGRLVLLVNHASNAYVQFSDNNGSTWSAAVYIGGGADHIAGDDACIICTNFSPAKYYVSADRGTTFGAGVSGPFTPITAIGYSAAQDRFMFMGVGQAYRSDNHGASLVPVGCSVATQVTAVIPQDDGSWVCLFRTTGVGTTSRIGKSSDGTTTFASETTPSIYFDGADHQRIAHYNGTSVAVAQGATSLVIVKSVNGGPWTNVPHSLPTSGVRGVGVGVFDASQVDPDTYSASPGRALPDVDTYYALENVSGGPTGYSSLEITSGTFRVLDSDNLNVGPTVRSVQADFNSQTYWEAAYAVAVADGYLPAGWTYGVEYPDIISTAYRVLTPTEQGDGCQISLATILDRLDARAGIPTECSVTTALVDIYVPGYAIDTFATVTEAKEPLRRIYYFDCPEYDDAIRYRLRGGATDFTIDPDALISGEDSAEQGTRGQTVEYPKRVHVRYIDPVTGYKPMKQTAERTSPDIRVKGEEIIEANITLDADTAKQAADIGMKVIWTEREDNAREFAVPFEYLKAIPSDTFSLEGHRYRITDMRIEAGALFIKSVYDRMSAYSSTASGNIGPAPVGQTSIVGPTLFAVLNMPVLRDADDMPGVYVAAGGYLPSWRGARLDVSRDAGTSYATSIIPDITQSATIGVLLDDLPSATKFSIDHTNTLRVRIDTSGGTLASVTLDQLLNEGNPCAIVKPDGTTEIVQFQTATEVLPNEYELTTLVRGALDTAPSTHSAGAVFVLLDSALRFVQLPSSDLGKTLRFRPVSLTTDPANNDTYSITLTTMESQREWQPYNVTVGKDDDCQWLVEFIGRHRLGTDASPVASQWWVGWRVDFTVGTVTKSHITREQSFLYTTELQTQDWGEVRCYEYEITVTSVNEYTGGDGSGGTGGGTGPTEWPGSEVFNVSGTFDGGYQGIVYDVRSGDFDLDISGGLWDGNSFGFVTDCVGTIGFAGLSTSFRAYGIPLDAGVASTELTIGADSPVPGHGGSTTVSQTPTFLAFPTYSPLDLRYRPRYGNRLVASSPPLSTLEIETPTALYSYGFTADDCYGEFEISGSSSPFWIGVNAAKGELTASDNTITLGYLMPSTASVSVSGDGTYYVHIDSSGNWEVGEVGGSSLGSGTLALSGSNQYRFVCTTDYVQTATVRANFGTEAFDGTPPGGYTGVLMPDQIVPAQWAECEPQSAMSFTGTYTGCVEGNAKGSSTTHHARARPGKSSGKWRVHIAGLGRIGLAVGTYTYTQGALGEAGTDDSVGWQANGVLNGQYVGTLKWCFGGVTGSVNLTVPLFAASPYPIFAIDNTAHTIKVCAWLTTGDVVVLHTLGSVPAGTWHPTEYSSSGKPVLTSVGLPGPADYADWTETFS